MVSFFYLSLLTIASAIQLQCNSPHPEVNHTIAHAVEQAPGDFIFYAGNGKGGPVFITSDDNIHFEVSKSTTHLGIDMENGILVAHPNITGGEFDIMTVSPYFMHKGIVQYQACKNIGDPSGNSAEQWAITYPGIGDECVPVLLEVIE